MVDCRGDAQSKKEKLELNDVLSKELNDWAQGFVSLLEGPRAAVKSMAVLLHCSSGKDARWSILQRDQEPALVAMKLLRHNNLLSA